MGSVTPLRVDERTLHAATVTFLRSAQHRRQEAERLYDLLAGMGVTDPSGKPAILTADDTERRIIYDWLLANTGRAA